MRHNSAHIHNRKYAAKGPIHLHNEWGIPLGYLGLFTSAFLAATILPLSSEIVLGALLLSGLSPTMLVIVATAGNVLGSLTSSCW